MSEPLLIASFRLVREKQVCKGSSVSGFLVFEFEHSAEKNGWKPDPAAPYSGPCGPDPVQTTPPGEDAEDENKESSLKKKASEDTYQLLSKSPAAGSCAVSDALSVFSSLGARKRIELLIELIPRPVLQKTTGTF
ncbi:uncharacterized protein V6R79_019104 [Siganus canaliculatus]